MQELLTIDVSSDKPNGLGDQKYQTLPRIGEWVEFEVNGEGTMFEVVMVAHSSSGADSDIYVKRIGLHGDAVRSICGSA